jgi:hypothetical protein
MIAKQGAYISCEHVHCGCLRFVSSPFVLSPVRAMAEHAQSVIHLICIRWVVCSKFSRDTDYPDWRFLSVPPDKSLPSIKINSGALVRQRTIPTKRSPLVGEVSANFSGYRVSRGQRNESPRPLISVFYAGASFCILSIFIYHPSIRH